jgi:chaperonin GroES
MARGGLPNSLAAVLKGRPLNQVCASPVRLVGARLGVICLSEGMTIMTTHFRPLHDRVLVRRVEGETKTAGGIIIPDTAKEKPMEGEVLAVGSGSRDENGKLQPLDVQAGDRILFGKWSGTEVKINGEELLIMKESDIMGVIDEKKAAKKAA